MKIHHSPLSCHWSLVTGHICPFTNHSPSLTNINSPSSPISKKSCTFAPDLVALKSVKRESGASPEQSRCCEFIKLQIKFIVTVCRHRHTGRLRSKERVRRPAKSEKIGSLSRKKCPKNRSSSHSGLPFSCFPLPFSFHSASRFHSVENYFIELCNSI